MDATDRTGHEAFGIYLHWPFCAQKCPYCDFNSHVRHGGWDEAAYLAGYRRELAYFAQRVDRAPVGSIFFGGGTPSLMQPATVASLLEEIARHWQIDDSCEVTLEANPGSVEAGRFRDFRAAGVNRVSVGVQSLRDEELRRLGRIHSAREALDALRIAATTFDRWSFDLIYARPRQTVEAWQRELREALAIEPRHLSLYQLTIEPETAYAALHAAGKLVIPGDDLARDLYEATQELCEKAGLPQYEVSNHAVPGQECRHNQLYWRYGTYVGAGPGAHGRVRIGETRTATVITRAPEAWLQQVKREGHGIAERHALSLQEQAEEALLMGLRLEEGFELRRLEALGGLTIDRATIAGLENLALVELTSPGRLRITREGRLVTNRVVAELAAALRPVS